MGKYTSKYTGQEIDNKLDEVSGKQDALDFNPTVPSGTTPTELVNLKDGSTYYKITGTPGQDGVTPHIDPTSGNWFIGTTDTGVHAEGPAGQDGSDGSDGHSPVLAINSSGYWTVDGVSTGVKAQGPAGQDGTNGTNGQDGVTPHIDSTSGNWFIGSTDTGVHAEGPAGQDGQDGTDGTNGQDGVTPHIDSTSKHWMIGSTDTGIVAEGQDGLTTSISVNGSTYTQSGGQITLPDYLTDHDLIDKENTLPAATETSPDFVQYDGKLYRKKVTTSAASNSSGVITDLTGTKWVINETPHELSSWVTGIEMSINFNSNGSAYTEMDVMYDDENGWLDIDYYDGSYNRVYNQRDTSLSQGWQNQAYRIIEITGGTDATNATLIAWLSQNATQVGTSYEYVEVGARGQDGVTPHIDSTSGNWFLGSTDTGVHAQGPAGQDGTDGTDGQDGQDGTTPHIDSTSGNWFLGSTDTGVHAQGPAGQDGTNGTNGQDGVTPHIDSTSKHWMIGSTDTNVVAEGQNGTNGTNGQDGVTPHIDSTTKHWMIGSTDTGVVAEGQTPSMKTLDGVTMTGSGDVKSGKVEQLYIGTLQNGIGTLNLATLSAKYSHVLLFAHSQYADGYDQEYVVDLSAVYSGTTVSIVHSVPGWQDQLTVYFFRTETVEEPGVYYLDWNGGGNHIVYAASVFGICKNS